MAEKQFEGDNPLGFTAPVPEGYETWGDYLNNPPPPTEALKELMRHGRERREGRMTGILATMTDEQIEAALAYRGQESHGDHQLTQEWK